MQLCASATVISGSITCQRCKLLAADDIIFVFVEIPY